MASPDFPGFADTESPIPPFLPSYHWDGEQWVATDSAGGKGGVPPIPGLGTPAQIAPVATGAGATAGSIAATSGAAGLTGASLLQQILKGLKDYGPLAGLGLSGYGAIKGLTQGPPAANEDLKRILGLAENRVNATEPLFQALNAMAYGQLPKYTKGQ